MKAFLKSTMTVCLMALTFISFGAYPMENSFIKEADKITIFEVAGDDPSSFIKDRPGIVASEDFSFSDNELEMLLHMKEEEKLARDVYAALFEKWKVPVFSNISKSENTHMNAVIYLLEKYGEEKTAVEEPGKFTNPDFQKLYDQLVAKGSVSLVEAFKTGALIEDLDIKDLTGFLGEVTDENIIMVFENLTRGSRNHLRAFNRQLVRYGITYIPEYISQEEFDSIISSAREAGNMHQRGRHGRPFRGVN